MQNNNIVELKLEYTENRSVLPTEAVFWNENHGTLPIVLTMSLKRMAHLRARRRDPFWVANYQEAVRRVSASDFCNGRVGGRGWRATFAWLIERPDAVANVMEGKYDGVGSSMNRNESTESFELKRF